MRRQRRSLSEECGGQFAFVTGKLSGDSGLSNGAVRLFLEMSRRADMDGYCTMSLKAFAKKLRISPRQVQRWKRELEERGCLEQVHKGDRPIGDFRVVRNHREWPNVALRNAPKLARRRIAKTRRATSKSQERDADVAGIKTHQENNWASSRSGLRHVSAAANQLMLGKRTKRPQSSISPLDREDGDDDS